MSNCPPRNFVTCVEKKPYPRDADNPDTVVIGYKDCDGADIDPCSEIPRCPEFGDGSEVPTDGEGHPVIPRVRVANILNRPLYPIDGTHTPDQMIGLDRSDGVTAEYDPETGVWQQQGIAAPSGVDYPFAPDGNQIVGIDTNDATLNPATGIWNINFPEPPPAAPEQFCRQASADILDTTPHPAGTLVQTPVETLLNPSDVLDMCVILFATVQVGISLDTSDRAFIQPYLTINGTTTPVWGQQGNGPAAGVQTHGATITFAGQHTIPAGGSMTFRLGATVVNNPDIVEFFPTALNIRAFGVTGA